MKFLRLRSSASEGGDYDPVALPTLLLYRAGEVVGCMTRVTDDIGENFTQEDVEWLLQDHDVFEVRDLFVFLFFSFFIFFEFFFNGKRCVRFVCIPLYSCELFFVVFVVF